MKISEVTQEYIANYLRLDEPTEIELQEIENMSVSAKSYIEAHTGMSAEELDQHEDITHAYLILIADMFDNRNLYIEGKASNVNKAVDRILGLHSVNLL
jgi:uncharacterized phage protein (predicted DNA packaging)